MCSDPLKIKIQNKANTGVKKVKKMWLCVSLENKKGIACFYFT